MSLLTTAEAAAILRRSVATIQRRCKAGLYPGAVRDGRDWRIPRELVVPTPRVRPAPMTEAQRVAREILGSL